MPSTSDPGFQRGLRYGLWLALAAVALFEITGGLASGVGLAVLAALPADFPAGALNGAVTVLAALLGVGLLVGVVVRGVEPEDADPSPLTLVVVLGLAFVGWASGMVSSFAASTLISRNASVANVGSYYTALAGFQWFAHALRIGGLGVAVTLAWMRARRPAD
ncbi:MAG: hypothetical protein H6735_32920 [Alphaproteobacteria bacterium]|nr:hypothetical protein [Alphaproteobacteria bacterium]